MVNWKAVRGYAIAAVIIGAYIALGEWIGYSRAVLVYLGCFFSYRLVMSLIHWSETTREIEAMKELYGLSKRVPPPPNGGKDELHK